VYINDILDILGSASDVNTKNAIFNRQSPIFSTILQMIIKFNRRRLEDYLTELAKNLGDCIQGARDEKAASTSEESSTEGWSAQLPFLGK